MTFWLVLIGTFAAMELVANLMHRFVMHGPLWILHKSHHEPRHDRFELNDLFGIFFAIPSIICIYFGTRGAPLLLAVGIGMAAYGLVYWGFHDVLVHRRVPHSWIPKGGYLRRIVQAHHIHHRTRTKDGALSFGFLYAPDPSKLKDPTRGQSA
jgi:beta-carotene 3-hydroxylase